MKFLLFRMYGAGLSNQRLSLELAVAIAHITKRTLVLYGFKPLVHSGEPLYDSARHYNITDLFEVPVNTMPWEVFQAEYSELAAIKIDLGRLSRVVFHHGISINTERFRNFLAGRDSEIFTLSDEQKKAPVLDFCSTRHFTQYSVFFYLPEKLRIEIIELIKKVRANADIRNTSRLVSGPLGGFSAIHVRQGDFLKQQHKFDIHDPESLYKNVSQCVSRDRKLVICTDEEGSDNFSLIKEQYPEIIFLESYILSTPELKQGYDSLFKQDAAVMGLLCQLVCIDAIEFAGSLRSTFTNYIHRLREQHNMLFVNTVNQKEMKIDCGAFRINHPEQEFTWQKISWAESHDPYSIAWQREWPESFE